MSKMNVKFMCDNTFTYIQKLQIIWRSVLLLRSLRLAFQSPGASVQEIILVSFLNFIPNTNGWWSSLSNLEKVLDRKQNLL